MATDSWSRLPGAQPSADSAGRETRVVATVIRVTTGRDRDGRMVAALYLKSPAFGLAVASSPHGERTPYRAGESWVFGVCEALDVTALEDLDGLTITVLLGSRPDGDMAAVGVAGVNGTYRFASALERR